MRRVESECQRPPLPKTMAGDDDRDTKTAVLEYYLAAPEKAPDGAIEELLLDPDVVFDDTLGCRIQLYHLRELDEAALEKALGEGNPSRFVRFFEDSVKFLADDKAQRPREMSLELRTLMVLQHLRRPRMDWKGGKKTLEELFKRPASEAEKSAKNALLEALDHAQQANEKKVKQLLKRHTFESLNSIMGDYLKEISAHLPEPKLSSTVGSALGIAEDESVQAVASLLSIGGHVVAFEEGVPEPYHKFFAHWSDGQDGYHSAADLASCPEFKKYLNAKKKKLQQELEEAAQARAEEEAQAEAERQAKAKAREEAKEKALAEAKLKKEKALAEAKLEARKEKELKAARMEELKAARMEQAEQGKRQPDPLHGEQSGASGTSPRPQKRQASASSPAASPRQARASSRVASPAAPAERRGRAAREAPVQASSSKQLEKERSEKEREEEEVARAVALAEKQKVAKKQRSDMSRAQVNKANEKRERQMSAIEKQEERLCAQLAKLQAEKAKLEKAGEHLGSCVHQLTRDEEAPHETVEEAEEEEEEVEEVTEGEDDDGEEEWEEESPASNVRAAVEGVRTGIRSAVRMVTVNSSFLILCVCGRVCVCVCFFRLGEFRFLFFSHHPFPPYATSHSSSP